MFCFFCFKDLSDCARVVVSDLVLYKDFKCCEECAEVNKVKDNQWQSAQVEEAWTK